MPDQLPLVVHATHEAGLKIGGIGAVLDGLLGAKAYVDGVARSVVVGPMHGGDANEMERLTAPRNRLEIRYSSLHAIFDNVPDATRDALQQVEQQYQVALLYGTRHFGGAEHEVILVDVSNPNLAPVDSFRFYVWDHYGIDCGRYGWDPEFNEQFTIALPLLAALHAIGADDGLQPDEKFLLAHEWLGMPLVFAAQINEPGAWRTIFYAHETATARLLVEQHPGHDTRFYNVMEHAHAWGLSLEEIFGDQSGFPKHAVIQQAIRCDNVFAVGDLVVDELRFLDGRFYSQNIDLVYNGVPSAEVSLAQKRESKRLLQDYAQNLLGARPDYVFTHVTRLVPSKALWRDVRVMEHLEHGLRDAGKTAVLFVLSTSEAGGRHPSWVRAWEAQYGWPLGHRGDNGDLVGAEVPYFFDSVAPFNAWTTNSRVVFVNQFGWDRERVGERVPAEMGFLDLRLGSDLEFGQSIYEPFGIAQVEPLSAGALCCVSNVCGCVGFVERASGGLDDLGNLVVADYVSLPDGGWWINSPGEAMAIDGGTREWIEGINSEDVARRILARLPKDDVEAEALLERGQEVARSMSWEVVVEGYLLPGLRRARG